MTDEAPLWPARLHHIEITSDQPPVLLDFYQRVLEHDAEELSDGRWLLAGGERNIVVGRGARNRLGFSAFAIDDPARVAALQDHVTAQGINVQPSPTPLFGEEAFAVGDPDGNTLVFGTPQDRAPAKTDRLPGRLQHSVVGSPNLRELIDFHLKLGFVLSDEIKDDDGNLTAVFLRSDEEQLGRSSRRHAHPAQLGTGPAHAGKQPLFHGLRRRRQHGGTFRRDRNDGPGHGRQDLETRGPYAQQVGCRLDAELIHRLDHGAGAGTAPYRIKKRGT
jgi:hypothetical protein